MRAIVLCVTATVVMFFLLYLNYNYELHKPIIIRTEKSTSNEKPKATSVLLVRATNTSLDNARGMLAEFDKQFNLQFQYPITVFHEEDFDASYQARLQDAVKSVKVDFALVKFGFPEWIDQSAVPETFAGWLPRHTSIGYRHMCRFFSGEIFKHPALAPYDYYWRLDDDSQYLNKVENDPFLYMQKNRKVYGWNIWMYENQQIAGKTLWTATNEYVLAHKIPPSSEYKTIETIGGDYDRCHYWNNFELLDLNFFRSPLYLNYYDYLDHKGGFYFSRWGDALVRTVFLKLFMQRDDIHYFDDISYKHQGMCSLVTKIDGIDCVDVHPDEGKHGDCKLLRRHLRGIDIGKIIKFLLIFGGIGAGVAVYRHRKSRA